MCSTQATKALDSNGWCQRLAATSSLATRACCAAAASRQVLKPAHSVLLLSLATQPSSLPRVLDLCSAARRHVLKAAVRLLFVR